MKARLIQAGDTIKDGSRWVVVGKVEFKSGAVFVWGHESNTNKKVCIKFSPEEETDIA